MIGLIPLRPQPQAWLWRSVLSPFAERYCEYLVDTGYAARTINIYVRCVAHFAYWLTTHRIAVASVEDRLVCSFVNDHLRRCTCPDPIPRGRADVNAALRHLLVVMGACAVPRFLRAESDSVQQEVCRFTDHLKDVCGLAECTRYQRGRIIRDFLHQNFGREHIDMELLTGQDIIDFNTLLRTKTVAGGKWKTQPTKTLADGTVKRILILVRHLFNEAIRDKSNVVKENPTQALQLTTVRKVKGKFLTAGQLGALLRAAEESENECLADIIRVMGGTGLRRENVLAMEWAWFDETRGTLTVPAEADKAKQGFVLHLSEGVANVLRERQTAVTGPWVFPNPKTGKPYYSCRDAWVTARNKANLPSLRMHDLRHNSEAKIIPSATLLGAGFPALRCGEAVPVLGIIRGSSGIA